MKEFDVLKDYPTQGSTRYVGSDLRDINSRIVASYRDKEYYDGDRVNGYGGFVYDGRWKGVANFIISHYSLGSSSSLLQLGCEKGFLLHEFREISKEIDLSGVDISHYAINNSMESIRPNVSHIENYTNLPFDDNSFDFVLAIGVVYCLNLSDCIASIKEIERVSRGGSFITLGAYETQSDLRLFKMWSVLGTTVLHVDEWIEVLKHCNYSGDYSFVTAKTLNLKEVL